MSKPSTSVAISTINSFLVFFVALNEGSYILGEYFFSATSKRSNCFSTRGTKPLQFFFSLGDHTASAIAKALGHTIYRACRMLYTCSVHRLACPHFVY